MSYQRANAPAHGHRWPWVAGAAVVIVFIGVLVAAFANPFEGSGDQRTSHYIEGIVGASVRVNPLFVYQSDADRDLAALIFTGLTQLGSDGTPEPSLAESWDTSDDAKTYTFHLRAGVTWHTGAEFNAEDVLFTYGLLGNPDLQGDPDQAQLWQTLQCSAPDNLTVTCVLPEPYAPFLTYATIGILPKHVLGTATAASILDDPFNRAPVGTGPYRLGRLDDARAVLSANEGFYLGAPAIEEIEVRFYPDVSAAAADVVQGEIDGLLVDLTINPEDYRTLQSLGGLSAMPANRSAYTSLYLNNREAPLNDQFVREAIAHTVDVDSIIADLIGGRAVRAHSPIAPGTWAYDGDVDAPSNDIGVARNLLDAGGWELPPDATVRRRNDVELRFSIMTDQDPLRGAIADAIAEQLTEIGIEATVVREASNTLVRDFLIPREYQAAIFGWDAGADPDPYPAWHSSQATGEGRNLAAYVSEDADHLMEAARQTVDMDERRELYSQFQTLFAEDAPSVPLFYPIYTYFMSDRIGGVEPGVLFTTASRFGDVQDWTSDTSPALGQ